MSFLRSSAALLVLSFTTVLYTNTHAQIIPVATYSNVLTSQLNPKITVSYKQPPAGTCMTAFTTQKQYTGYITIPPFTLAPIQQNYTINTFFWFIEARQTPDTAPLTVWLNGGPGSSSMFGMFNEVGPCEVVQMSDGTYGTQSRPWGWDRSTNILFIDQPNQVGFSYDQATNGSLDLFREQIYEPPAASKGNLPSFMYLNGTFGTINAYTASPGSTTANTTDIAAQAVWHFLQTWLSSFPQYNPATKPNVTATANSTAGIHLFTESYGGKYGPVMATYFEEQNALLANGTLPAGTAIPIQLETVGIINGIIDDAVQNKYYPTFAYNNTYGIQAIDQVDELNSLQLASSQCASAITTCRNAMQTSDPLGHGDNALVNKLCQAANNICYGVSDPYYNAGFNPYDIRQQLPSPDPPVAYQEYLNNGSVLAAIGARVNYTESNRYVQKAFLTTGDTIRGGQVEDLAQLLSMGIRVALLYGDADYICNWYGGEAISLAIASQLQPQTSRQVLSGSSYATSFPAAGYSQIVVNSSYVGGAVRQYGNLSFSRIYDAGHFIPFYQPETAFTVFTRIIYGTSISTGQFAGSNYSSTGPANATHINKVPPAPASTCWVREFNTTCSQDDETAMLQGKGVVAYGIYYRDGKVNLPGSSVIAGVPGRPTGSNSTSTTRGSSTTSANTLTGVYTATGTPTPSAAAIDLRPRHAVLAALPLGVMALL